MALTQLPDAVETEEMLDGHLTTPDPALVEAMARLDGDLLVLGIGGKMGLTLGVLARRAMDAAGSSGSVIGVSRFSDPTARSYLETERVETIACDLLDRDAVQKLPSAPNVIYVAGRKFGTRGTEPLTWAANVVAPDNAAQRYRDSCIVAFSTGCVYPLVAAETGGSTEDDGTDPVGEYAQSCLGRERVFQYWSQAHGTPICLFRLNYAIDLRYGVLHDIGLRVYRGQPVDLGVSHFNAIWQRDANAWALRCLGLASSPASVINVTGPESISVRRTAERFAELFGSSVTFTGREGGARMYLSNATFASELFGRPTVSVSTMIRWQAEWIRRGGRSLGKPTHFGVVDGQY